DVTSNFSAWAIESELNLADQFFVKGSLEYDSNISELQFGNTTLEYRNDKFFAQSSYRYVSRNYIASTTGNQNLDLVTKNGISQIGVVTGFPLTSKISLNAQYFYDTTQDMMLESLMQLTYRSSCWTIGLGYNEYLLSRSNINDLAKYENNISLSFSLLGLGTNSSFGYNSASGNALGYRSLFALNN
ncbi:MAG: LPS assembly protein LptD, partial [Enterovibrio sp.]